jgi:hypothetical protein
MPRILQGWEQAKLVEKELMRRSGTAFARRLSLSEEIRRALTDWSSLQDILTKARAEAGRPSITSGTELRRTEVEWFLTHGEELKEYQNQWVAIERNKIVAHGATEEEVDSQARSQGVIAPFVIYIPGEDERPFIGWVSAWL